ncbi:Phosphoenolpyruvate/pyruvate domain-containing protein [Hortaea werneckii]|nr:Phosphoenolpyruvate/pyruvate domain-containing protein [Hortaea werneckii]KAI7405922.1 Phosphoenolpyruvate/pyruvate domain-containing protein [Hortaea werneckii]
MEPISAPRRLRQMLADPSKTVVAPGVYDGISTRLALAQGFDCLYMTGAGTSMSRLGMADLGLTTFVDMLQNALMIASINPSVPVIADADTGYGGPINVAHTVKSYARAGVAGLHIEDQVQEKRCGHLSGKLLVSREVYYNRLRAACKARDESGSGIVIIARTDARAGKDNEGNGGFEEAAERLKAAAEIGVDGLFFEAIQAKMKLSRTPIIANSEANKIGFRIVIWPTMGLEAVVPALQGAYASLKQTDRSPPDQQIGPGALFETCGLKDLMDFDESVGGKAYK